MRLQEIQAALRDEGLDGWLFFDHHRRDPLAYRVLQFTPGSMLTRRWYYFVPATGKPYVVGTNGGGSISFTDWDKQVSITAPKGAVDISSLSP